MHRRKPISAKQRKEQLQLKRAVKRGDVPAPPPSKPDRRKKSKRGPTGNPIGQSQGTRNDLAESSRRLESSFVKLPQQFLERTKLLASTLPLPRPIAPDLAILPEHDHVGNGPEGQLACMKRPKWRYDMSKKEVEANEEGMFKKWLAQTDAAVHDWCNPDLGDTQEPTSADPSITDSPKMPRAPTSFERNLEVWRQLWRVTEISQILLVLLDSRCPTLHLPPALTAYLAALPNASRLRTILVLTKVDISGSERAASWTKYLNERYPSWRVVQVESYQEKAPDANGSSRKTYEPHLPSVFRQTLVDALREAHAELLEPPASVKSHPERLASWKPKVRAEVDWNGVLSAHGGQVGTAVGGASMPRHKATPGDPDGEKTGEQNDNPDGTSDDDTEPEFLTIGLIGQPNVGKSSLLNALFGIQKVRASRTPGKTKHFQTLFWTPDVRLVDCPGLVIPNYVPMETQVLSGILPISRVSAVPLCIHHAGRLLPLERILGLAHPSLLSPPPADKRTWRTDTPRATEPAEPQQLVWTAMDVLTAYATKKGWVTAKAGRPDVNRAGNAILRALAEGKIRWAFWPPGTDPATIAAHCGADGTGSGIWIAHADAGGDDGAEDIDSDHESEHDGAEDARSDVDVDGPPRRDRERAVRFEGEHPASDESEDDESEDDAVAPVASTTGRFGALLVADETDDESEEEG